MKLRLIITTIFFNIFLSYAVAQSPFDSWSVEPTELTSFFNDYSLEVGLFPGEELIPKYQNIDELGRTHVRFIQKYKGLDVLGGSYVLHHKPGEKVSGNGNLIKGINLGITPKLSSAIARSIAKNYMSECISPAAGLGCSHNFKTSVKLAVTSKDFPDWTNNAVLIYSVELKSLDNRIQYCCWINANTGAVMHSYPLIAHAAVPTTGTSYYYGEVEFVCDSIDPDEFILQDLTRGQGIITKDLNGNTFRTQSLPWNLSPEGLTEAIDLHWCATQFYDYMLENHQWDGLDGFGSQIISSLLHFYNGASWQGNMAHFGRGDCNHGPWTTLEIVAHEFFHGIIDHTSGLHRSNEAGALSESICDVFAKAIEYSVDIQNFNWQFGRSIQLNDYSGIIRDHSDPHIVKQPKYYEGKYWEHSVGYVHKKSAVASHWFYLLVEGGKGKNEVGNDFDIEGIGMEKAIDIVFRVVRDYLFPTSDFMDYYQYTTQVVQDIYGPASPEHRAVLQSWRAVGLPASPTPPYKDLSITFELSENSTCGDSVLVPFSYTITNLGTEEFVPERFVVVAFGGEVIRSLDQPIQPGESLSFTDSTTFVQTDYAWDWKWMSLDWGNLEDDKKENNSYTIYYRNGNSMDGDLELRTHSNPNTACSPEELNIPISVWNRSCLKSSAGRMLEILAINQVTDERITFNHILREIEFLNRETIEIDIPISWSGDSILVLNNSIDDPNPRNDSSYSIYNSFELKAEGYRDEFDTFESDRYHVYQAYGAHGIGPYQGENVLWWTGSSYLPTRYPCFETERNLSDNSAGSLSFCANMEGVLDPSVSFDMAFLFDEAYKLPDDFTTATSAVRLSILSDQFEESHLIMDNLEEDWKKYKFPLPKDFYGEIRFDFYAYSGYRTFNLDTLRKKDVILMDNLSLLGGTTSTIKSKKTTVQIFPNPANNRVFIKNLDRNQIEQIEVWSSDGKCIVSHVHYDSEGVISVNGLIPGLYWLRILRTDGQVDLKPFVKS